MKKIKKPKPFTKMRGLTDTQLLEVLRAHEVRLNGMARDIVALDENIQKMGELIDFTRQAITWCLVQLKHPAFVDGGPVSDGEHRTAAGLIVPPGVAMPKDADAGSVAP